MSTRFLDLVRQASATTGTGASIVLASTAYANNYLTMAESGAVDQAKYSYIINDGTDFEIQYLQTWTASTRTFARGTPVISKIGGVAGTTQLTLSGNQSVRLVASAKDLTDLFNNAKKQAIIFG